MPDQRKAIQETFMKLFEGHNLKIPDDNLQKGKPGSIPYGSGRIMFAFGTEDETGFMEYYAHHRIGGDSRGRIYEDGSHVSLPELCSMVAYNPNIPGDRERREKENREEYEWIFNELVEVGIFSAGPVPGSLMMNAHLVMRKDEED